MRLAFISSVCPETSQDSTRAATRRRNEMIRSEHLACAAERAAKAGEGYNNSCPVDIINPPDSRQVLADHAAAWREPTVSGVDQ